MKKIFFSLLVIFTYVNATVDLGACKSCHGQSLDKKALGASIKINTMSEDQLVKSLKGYKHGTYGRELAAMMVNVVVGYSDSDLEKIAKDIATNYAQGSDTGNKVKSKARTYQNINTQATSKSKIEHDNLQNKKELNEKDIGIRHSTLYKEAQNHGGVKTDYNRNFPGSSTRFERAYQNAPPMIPHAVEGLLPITRDNHQCLGCHMPDVASGVGATPIPKTHFTNYRPKTIMKNGKVYKEGKVLGKELHNTSDIKIAKIEQYGKHITMGRFNCTQCHAPQSKTDTMIGSTFTPDFGNDAAKRRSFLIDTMNEGVK